MAFSPRLLTSIRSVAEWQVLEGILERSCCNEITA
jgi:hypothetical protein